MAVSVGTGRAWEDVFVERRQGYKTSVTDYHEHGFYEINLILSGNVKVLLQDRFAEGCENRIVLTAPNTPHYVTCRPDTLYSRQYLLFTHEFAADFLPAWGELSTVFGENGNTIPLTAAETLFLKARIEEIGAEKSPLGKRLLLYHLLLRLSELSAAGPREEQKPQYLLDAISYIEANYRKHLTAGEIAGRLYVGRTTLMTQFKRRLGCTLNDYITDCRLKHAERLLREGDTLDTAAEKCGFADSSGLTRAFKRRHGVPPRQFVQESMARTKREKGKTAGGES